MAQRPKPQLAEQPPEIQDALENVRRGTLQQFESEWILLNVGEVVTRRHGLGEEVPALVSVDLDDTGDGRNAIGATTEDVTVQSTPEEIIISNETQTRQYFRIRAR